MPEKKTVSRRFLMTLLVAAIAAISVTPNSASADTRTLKYKMKLECKQQDVQANYWVYDGTDWKIRGGLHCYSEGNDSRRGKTIRREHEFSGEFIMVRFVNYTTRDCHLENRVFEIGKNHVTQCDLGEGSKARFVMYRSR